MRGRERPRGGGERAARSARPSVRFVLPPKTLRQPPSGWRRRRQRRRAAGAGADGFPTASARPSTPPAPPPSRAPLPLVPLRGGWHGGSSVWALGHPNAARCMRGDRKPGVVWCVCARARVARPRCDSCVPSLVTARLLTRQRAVTVSLVVARHRVHSPPWSPLLGCPRPLVCATRPLALCSSSHRRTRSRRADHCVRAILSPLPWRSAEPPQHAGPPGAHEVQQVPAQDDAAQGDQEEVKTLL